MSRNSGTPTSFFTEWSEQADDDPTVVAGPVVDTSTSRRRAVWERTALARRRVTALGAVVASAAAVGLLLPGSDASADPSPSTWHRLRMCESSNNYKINTGNGYYGAYQFDLSTWRSVGGSGYPNQASAAEQDARALILYRMRGWQPWTCASILGLREDSDARSGRTGDIHIGSGGTGSNPTPGKPHPQSVPAFPGSRWYRYGDWNNDIKTFQDQMHKRGYFPAGTGQYGPLTLAMVKQLQLLNKLIPNGYIGPNTWRLAWTGRYTAPTSSPAPAKPAKPAKPSKPSKPSRPSHSTIPAFPGTRWYRFGDWSKDIKTFQDAMHARGYFPAGTGQYGPLTLAMVKQLQRRNGLVPNGLIGPHTWKLAWTGTYTEPAAAKPAVHGSIAPFPGTRWYRYGDWNNDIKTFQDAMHARGYFPAGTGQYGPNTLHMVKRLQQLNGLIPNGLIGPKTWRLAWTGKYS
jgi:peptidoglycan hydrolase-like protein with peptidoglycan-binding domain